MVTAVLSGLGSHNGHPAYAFHATGATPTGTATVDDRAHVNVVTSGGRSEYVEYGYANDDTHPVRASPVVMERDETTVAHATPLIFDVLSESIASWTESVADTERLNDFDDTKQIIRTSRPAPKPKGPMARIARAAPNTTSRSNVYLVPSIGDICKVDCVVVSMYDNHRSGSLETANTTQTIDVLRSETL